MNIQIVDKFVERLEKLNITVSLLGNIPWIYLDKVNGKKVNEKFMGNHGFTAFFYPARIGGVVTVTSISEIFKIIRKYK